MRTLFITFVLSFLAQPSSAEIDYDKLAFNFLLRELVQQSHQALKAKVSDEKKPRQQRLANAKKPSDFWHHGASSASKISLAELQAFLQDLPSYRQAKDAWLTKDSWSVTDLSAPECRKSAQTLVSQLGQQTEVSHSMAAIEAKDLACISLNLVTDTLRDAKHAAVLGTWLEQIDRTQPDTTHSLLLAWYHLRQQSYPLSLRYNYRLVWQRPSYRFTYEGIQWLYSMREKGNGSVALRKL